MTQLLRAPLWTYVVLSEFRGFGAAHSQVLASGRLTLPFTCPRRRPAAPVGKATWGISNNSL